MNHNLALRVIGNVMSWDEQRCRDEMNWLRVISRFRYDGYQGFIAGARFVESLVYWLQQFAPEDREDAYQYVRTKIVYFSNSQTENLVRSFQPEFVQNRLMKKVAEELGVPPYLVWANIKASDRYTELLRKTLFFGLSDGARMDVFRRSNPGVISNEQVVVGAEINGQKWNSLLKKLEEDCGDNSKFQFLFLVDDFTASGTTLLRNPEGHWKGKLFKFFSQHADRFAASLAPDWTLCVHHHIGTAQAEKALNERLDAAQEEIPNWFKNVELSFGTILNNQSQTSVSDTKTVALLDKYYNPSIETSHNAAGGTNDVRMGYANCGLNLILEHNTPNNSLPLLWASADANENHPEMRPLFQRKQRHT